MTRFLSLRVFLFLLVVFAALVWTLRSREDRWGGLARYEGRRPDPAVWDSLRPGEPTPEAMLALVCRYACKDSTWVRILRPDDNLHHMLASLARPEDGPPSGNPEKILGELLWMEEGIDLRGQLDRRTTLADVLRLLRRRPAPH